MRGRLTIPSRLRGTAGRLDEAEDRASYAAFSDRYHAKSEIISLISIKNSIILLTNRSIHLCQAWPTPNPGKGQMTMFIVIVVAEIICVAEFCLFIQ